MCPLSVCRSVGLSVCRSVGLSVCRLALPFRHSQMAKEGVVTPLLELASVAHPSVSHHVAGALANLTCQRASCETLTEYNAVDVVLELCQHDDEHVLWCCAVALANLTALPGQATTLVSQRVVAALITLARSAETRTTRLCASVLYNLSCDAAAVPSAIDAGFVRAMHRLVKATAGAASEAKDPDGVPEAVLRLCAAAACNCAAIEACRADVTGAGLPDILMQVLASVCREDTVSFAANAFCHLSANAECLVPLAEARVVPALVNLAHHASTPRVATALTRVVLRVASNLSHSPEARPLLVEQGVVKAVVHLSDLASGVTDEDEVFLADSDKDSGSEDFKDDNGLSPQSVWRLRGEYHEATGLFLWMLSSEPCATDALVDSGGLTALLTLARCVCGSLCVHGSSVLARVCVCVVLGPPPPPSCPTFPILPSPPAAATAAPTAVAFVAFAWPGLYLHTLARCCAHLLSLQRSLMARQARRHGHAQPRLRGPDEPEPACRTTHGGHRQRGPHAVRTGKDRRR